MPDSSQNIDDLLSLIDLLPNARVLVIGDIILDRFVYGDVHRISSEAPIPILNMTHETSMPGGAGNTLGNLSALGADVRLCSVIGQDPAADRLRSYLDEMALPLNGLIVTQDRQTSIKIRYMNGTHQLLCVHDETTKPILPETETLLCRAIDQALEFVNVMVISDYGRGAMTESVIRHAIHAAQKRNIKILVDPRSSDFTVYRGADMITPNRNELAIATGKKRLQTDSDIESVCQTILKTCDIKAVLATRSKDGMSLITPDIPPLHLRAQAREVFDVSGAGDTVVATMAALVSIGADLKSAAILANLAGGIVVGKTGTAKIYADDLKQALCAPERQKERNHPMSWNQALDCVNRWKAQGKKIGFTNGCFDILHKGHVSYLNAARKKCDHLIVGINADSSVRRLKGNDRPYNDETSRAEVLSALACVDAVVLFGEDLSENDTACTIISTLKPDVYFKAGDYTPETLPETPIVLACGGQVEIMPFESGYSTTSTLDRMKGHNKKTAA